MNERRTGLDKYAVLKALSTKIRSLETDPDSANSETDSGIADSYASLAKEMGATEFELADAYFSGIPEKENRQDLLDVYCEKLWHDKSFESFDELVDWSKDMIRLRNKYKLRDSLEPEMRSAKKNEDQQNISAAFRKEKDRQSLFDLYSFRLQEDESFESFEELEKWAGEMVKIRNKYNLKDTFTQEKKHRSAEVFKGWPKNRFDSN